MPSQLSTSINSRRATAAVASRKRFARGVVFGEDVVAVVEVVELLGKLEGVLGEVSRLGGGDALLDDQRAASGAAARVSQMASPSSPAK